MRISKMTSTGFATTDLIYNLCCKETGLTGGNVSSSYQLAVNMLGSTPPSLTYDEFAVVELIKKKLIKEKREKDAVIFMELHLRLQASPLLRNRVSVLQLLFALSGIKGKNAIYFSQSLPLSKIKHLSPVLSQKILTNGEAHKSRLYGGSMVNYDDTVLKGCPDMSALPEIQASESLMKKHLSNMNRNTGESVHRVARITAMYHVNTSKQDSTESSPTKRDPNLSPRNKQQNLKAEMIPTIEVSEKDLLRDLLFAFQGIEGRIIKRDSLKGIFYIAPKLRISTPVREIVFRLIEIGWLYSQVHNFCLKKNCDQTYGLVGQSFVSAVQEQLTEYYRLIALLEAQLHQDTVIETNSMTGGLTLRRLMVWCMDPFVRMKFLAAMVDACSGQKGGALASVVYSFLHHGDPVVRQLVKHILLLVSQPIMNMLRSWMFYGELEDNYSEFFVTFSSNARDEINIWNDKYTLRKAMIPSFLSMEQAQKILSTGKAINFLREVCQDHTDFKGASWLKADKNFSAINFLFTMDKESEFQSRLDKTYNDISKHVLSVLHTEFHFMDHLQAMRRYLLLGQGDFIRYLMDQLESELNKPASQVQLHNLTSILDCAIRSTNAQFDKQEILDRLDVKLEIVADGELGWEVFSLGYHLSGPIGTIFTPHCRNLYTRLFHSLFQSKRIEYVLSSMWMRQMSFSQLLRSLQDTRPVLHQFQLLLSEMVHFVQQMQYYIAFEVMECGWADLQSKVKDAEDLDHIIIAHEEFLDTVCKQALLREESEHLRHRLKQIYENILYIQSIQDDFWERANLEIQNQAQREAKIQKSSETWTRSNVAELEIEEQRQKEFVQVVIPRIAAQIRTRARSYHDAVNMFLKMLMEDDDQNLRFLSFRLDFNEYYKKQNTSLQTSLTFLHRRKSMANFS